MELLSVATHHETWVTMTNVYEKLPAKMQLPRRGIGSEVLLAESSRIRITVICMSLFYMVLIALCQGVRYGRMIGRRSWSSILESLVLLQCFICVAFITTVAVMEAGLGMTSATQCDVAIRLCIVLYACGKVSLYLFFNERIHILRAPFMNRLRDPIWIAGMVMIVGGFGGVQAYASIAPEASFDKETGYCNIGIAADAAICVIVLDSIIGGILTAIFVKILWPAVQPDTRRSLDSTANSGTSWLKWLRRKEDKEYAGNKQIHRKAQVGISSKPQFKTMLWRNILGSATVLANTLINNVIFLTWVHSHRSEVCLLTCLTDIVWGTLVTSWLTMGSAKSPDRPRLRKSKQLSDASTLVPVSPFCKESTPWEKHWDSHAISERVYPTTNQVSAIPWDIRALGVIPEPDE